MKISVPTCSHTPSEQYDIPPDAEQQCCAGFATHPSNTIPTAERSRRQEQRPSQDLAQCSQKTHLITTSHALLMTPVKLNQQSHSNPTDVLLLAFVLHWENNQNLLTWTLCTFGTSRITYKKPRAIFVVFVPRSRRKRRSVRGHRS